MFFVRTRCGFPVDIGMPLEYPPRARSSPPTGRGGQRGDQPSGGLPGTSMSDTINQPGALSNNPAIVALSQREITAENLNNASQILQEFIRANGLDQSSSLDRPPSSRTSISADQLGLGARRRSGSFIEDSFCGESGQACPGPGLDSFAEQPHTGQQEDGEMNPQEQLQEQSSGLAVPGARTHAHQQPASPATHAQARPDTHTLRPPPRVAPGPGVVRVPPARNVTTGPSQPPRPVASGNDDAHPRNDVAVQAQMNQPTIAQNWYNMQEQQVQQPAHINVDTPHNAGTATINGNVLTIHQDYHSSLAYTSMMAQFEYYKYPGGYSNPDVDTFINRFDNAFKRTGLPPEAYLQLLEASTTSRANMYVNNLMQQYRNNPPLDFYQISNQMRPPPEPPPTEESRDPDDINDERQVTQYGIRMRMRMAAAKRAVEMHNQTTKPTDNQRQFNIGDRVLVRDLAPKPGLTKGLLPKFKGPATVVACRPYSAIVAFDGSLDQIRVRYRHLRKFNTPNEPDEPSNEPDGAGAGCFGEPGDSNR